MIFLASRAPDCVRHVASRARAAVSRGGGRGGRGASRGRFACPRGRRCAGTRRAVALAVLALLLFMPSVANAEIAYDPLPGTSDGFVAPYRYDLMGRMSAAGEVIDRDFAWLTDEQQQYIIDYKGGENAFVQFANDHVINLGYEPSPGANALSAVFPFFVSSFGRNEVWYFFAEPESVENARVDYDLAWEAYLKDSGLGGGDSGDSSTDDYDSYKATVCYNGNTGSNIKTSDGTTYYTDGVTEPQLPDNVYIRLRKDLFSSRPVGYDSFIVVRNDGSNYYLNAIMCDVRYRTINTELYYPSSLVVSGPATMYSQSLTVYPRNITVVDGVVIVDATGISSLRSTWVNSTAKYTYACKGGLFSDTTSGGDSEPTYPDPPQPPEIPEPDPPETKPIDDPGITLPPINFPDLVLPDIDYTVETPTGTDVVPYLKKIIANQEDIAAYLSDALSVIDEDLDNIGEALGEHCNHLQQQLQKQVYWLATELQDMFDGLEVGISNYLYRVQTKLLQGIGWEFDNLSQDVISWLKRIYSRLGGNGISKPDPTTDPVGFWDWLIKQFSDFFEDLFGKSTSGLTSLFDSLKEFFPFSLPWDIVALLGLFVHEPVTPVFDLPMPVPAIVSDTRMYLIHVDCHPWDGTMQIVRGLEFVFFAYYLMRMVPSWFNEIKVSGM